MSGNEPRCGAVAKAGFGSGRFALFSCLPEATFAGDNRRAETLKRSATRIGALAFRGIPLSNAYPADDTRRRGFYATSLGDAENIYRAAMRHSRHVHWLRIGVPAAIAAALIVVVASNYMPAVGGLRLPGELGYLVIKGTKVTMQQPRLSGFINDSRPYQFTADSAEQDITKPDFMELHQIKARVEMEDKSIVNITSMSGSYDMKAEMLTLADRIHLVSSTGYEARLAEAAIDVRKGTVLSEKPVWVKLTNGVLNAKRLEVVDGGQVMLFSGGVSVTLQPQNDVQASAR